MTDERRALSRCPICSGTATSDPNQPGGIRCRNSSCKQNHQHVECPRCKAFDLAQVIWKDHAWNYTCADCQNSWSSAQTN